MAIILAKAPSNPFNENESLIKKVSNAKREASASEQVARAHISDTFDPEYGELMDLIFRYSATGNFKNQMELFFSRIDRFGASLLPMNIEHVGLTFFSRPKLALAPGNLVAVPPLIPLNTLDPHSYAFATRCWLDTKFSRTGAYADSVLKCPFFDIESAINVPLSNAVVAQSGWPDPFIQTFTTTGGFYCEDQTFPIGSDRLRRTYDINFTFKEGPGAPILSMLYTWYEAMACLTEGSMIAYAEDINAQRMCYTCSIYRFLLDPSKTHITHYAKATGCFPKAPPMGALFNHSRGEVAVQAAQEISIPFTVNKVEYDDPRILLDFNFLITRYCNNIASYPVLRPEAYNNFRGYPFVLTTHRGLELVFREPETQAVDDEYYGKMRATTRERFELQEEFASSALQYEGTKIRGPETRYLYRVKPTSDGEMKLILHPNDDYAKMVELDNRGSLMPTKDQEYRGTLKDELRKVISGTSMDNSGYSDPDLGEVNQFDPVFVTGPNMGLLDTAAINRANATEQSSTSSEMIAVGNHDIVDAGANPNPINAKSRYKKE